MAVLALDFDGVLCDSARETGITGWKVARDLWQDMVEPLPPQSLLDKFFHARPVIETGFEAILMMRLLKDGAEPEDLLESFQWRLQEYLVRPGTDAVRLKRLYGAVRDRWIQEDPQGWLSLSPLYPGVGKTLNNLPSGVSCYIVTTKQERFVQQLLEYNGVPCALDHIFGLDRGMTKEAMLLLFLERHPNNRVHLVEDRLATLKRVLPQPDLAAVRLHMACWGYNTESECREAGRLNIHLLSELDLEAILNTEYDSDQ
jgi:phosphoglycolate phosphatase-like HAD superfamily hydrolase